MLMRAAPCMHTMVASWPVRLADLVIVGTYSGTIHAVYYKAVDGNEPSDEAWAGQFSEGW